MDIEVWSVGSAKFPADPEYQEPAIREAIDQRGDVASVIIDYTDSERSNISYDEYARVTGDVPGLVLFEGWLTRSSRSSMHWQSAPGVSTGKAIAARHAAEAGLPPEAAAIIARAVPALAEVVRERDAFIDAADFERKRVIAMKGLLAEILTDLKAGSVGHRVAGQMPNGWGADEYQIALWRERAERAGVELP